MIREERLEMPSSAHKAGLKTCQYGESRESGQFGSLVPTKGVYLGTQNDTFQTKFKAEVKRSLERVCGFIVSCSERPGVDAGVRMKRKGVAIPFR